MKKIIRRPKKLGEKVTIICPTCDGIDGEKEKCTECQGTGKIQATITNQ
jgi:hypothetical protein